jgi:hypothetical protein
MPTPASEAERIICASDDCDQTGEYRNDYLPGLYCLICHENIMDNYYEENDSENDDDDDDNESRTIHSYSYKPRASFMKSDGTHSAYVTYLDPNMPGNVRSNGRTTMTMGFELETQYTGDESFGRQIPQELLNDVNSSNESDIYLKEDGSVYNGFEIVSHPGELDYFMNHFKWKGIENLARKGFQAWKRPCCGLHIHVAKSAFADTSHKFKFIAFVYKNRPEMVQLAGRESHDYASYDIKRFLNSHRDWVGDNGKIIRHTNLMKMAKGEDCNNTRSVAVNIQNEKTIELRLFKPSLKTETVRVALQFCDALFNYTEIISTYDILQKNALTFPEFRKWVTANNEKYKVLDTRISERVKVKSTGRDV